MRDTIEVMVGVFVLGFYIFLFVANFVSLVHSASHDLWVWFVVSLFVWPVAMIDGIYIILTGGY